MRFTKKEKQVLFELLDCVTDDAPDETIMKFHEPENFEVIWSMYAKMRMENNTYYLQNKK